MSLKVAFAAIRDVDCAPELQFVAAMVASALEAAKAGDDEAFIWIERCSLRWLHAITPAEHDCEEVQQALLATLPAAGTFRAEYPPASEIGCYVQRFMPGLEA